MKTSFFSEEELATLGFKSVGSNVLISRSVRFYGLYNIKIGNNVRIDDYCVLSAGKGGIVIGDYVHIAVFSTLQGQGKITLEDFSGISSKVSIYSSNENYSGEFMTNPTVPSKYTGVIHSDVRLCKHSIVGSGAVILPGVTLYNGSVVGALSFVNKDCEEFYIYKGNPAKKIVKRSKDLLKLEKQFVQNSGLH